MSVRKLEIKDLSCKAQGKSILRGLSLEIKGGEIHVLMGPGGTGKSTLASVLMGHPAFEVTAGEVFMNGQNLLSMRVDERARAGLFLAMKEPASIPGVKNADFLRTAINDRLSPEEKRGPSAFRKQLKEELGRLEMAESFSDFYLNDFKSDDEKIRSEFLQMLLLRPAFALLDNFNSEPDNKRLAVVGQHLNRLLEEQGDQMGLLLISPHQGLFEYVRPHFVHVMMAGRIVQSGGPELLLKLEREGYDDLQDELGLPAYVSDSALSEEEIAEAVELPPSELIYTESFERPRSLQKEKEIFSDGLDILV